MPQLYKKYSKNDNIKPSNITKMVKDKFILENKEKEHNNIMRQLEVVNQGVKQNIIRSQDKILIKHRNQFSQLASDKQMDLIHDLTENSHKNQYFSKISTQIPKNDSDIHTHSGLQRGNHLENDTLYWTAMN